MRRWVSNALHFSELVFVTLRSPHKLTSHPDQQWSYKAWFIFNENRKKATHLGVPLRREASDVTHVTSSQRVQTNFLQSQLWTQRWPVCCNCLCDTKHFEPACLLRAPSAVT